MFTRVLGFSRVHRARSFFSYTTSSIPCFSSGKKATMVRLTGRALENDMATTVIEDSEPEREAERAMIKEQRRRRRAEAKRQKEQAEQVQKSHSSEVIIISDSERNVISASPIGQSVIEISDTTIGCGGSAATQLEATHLIVHESTESLTSDEQPGNIRCTFSSGVEEPNSNQGLLINEHNAPIDLAACITSTADSDPPTRKLDLSRFAFAGPSAKPMSSLPKPVSTISQPAPRVRKTMVLDLPLADIFTTSQLTALSKCVVCDLAWTTRKTVPVKMLHMKRCAKKNAWKEETVIIAMTEAIDSLPVPVVDERKNTGKGKVLPEDEAPKTYLEDVVNEAAPKKRRRRAQDMEIVTVLNPQDAHAAIMERAKALFGRGPIDSSSGFPKNDSAVFPSTQAFGPSKLGTSGGSGARAGVLGTGMLEDQTAPTYNAQRTGKSHGQLETEIISLPPSTQAFLGSTFAKRPIFLHGENYDGNIPTNEEAVAVPPPTQKFGQSRLAERFGKTKQSIFDVGEDSGDEAEYRAVSPLRQPLLLHNPARPSKPIISSPNPLLTPPRLHDARAPSTSPSTNAEHHYLPMTAQMRLLDLNRCLAEIHTSTAPAQHGVKDMYPILPSVFEKLARARAQVQQDKEDEAQHRVISKGKQKVGSRSSSSLRASSRSPSRSTWRSKKPRRRKSRSPFKSQRRIVTAETGNHYDNDLLDKDMSRIIMEDKELYMKILRYEPINFDIFLKVAKKHGLDGRGVGVKLRAFLDRQAINFYGDSALITNRGRYK